MNWIYISFIPFTWDCLVWWLTFDLFLIIVRQTYSLLSFHWEPEFFCRISEIVHHPLNLKSLRSIAASSRYLVVAIYRFNPLSATQFVKLSRWCFAVILVFECKFACASELYIGITRSYPLYIKLGKFCSVRTQESLHQLHKLFSKNFVKSISRNFRENDFTKIFWP